MSKLVALQRNGINLHKLNTNKSQNDLKVKKKIFNGINPNEQTVDPESIFSIEEIDNLKNCFYDESRYEKFLNKISILQKATISKEKEMNMKIKLFENQLKQKEREIKSINEKSKEKDNKNIRKILTDFGISHDNNSNINMADKIHEQYQEIQKLQKDIKVLKEKNNSLSRHKRDDKSINLSTDNSNKFNQKFFINKKITLNSIQRIRNNIHKLNTNKSQSDLKVKKKMFSGLNPVDQINNPESIFTVEEIDVLKNSFFDESKYQKFLNKISILQKASISKEKEMNMKTKIFENQLKQKEKGIKTLNENSIEKDKKITELNLQNKELIKIQDDLVNKIKYLANEFNQLEEKNQMIQKKNEQLKNSIFNIDGIIEATSKEGEPIPLFVEERKDSITIKKNEEKSEKIKDDEKN